jgi:hypothetical protein
MKARVAVAVAVAALFLTSCAVQRDVAESEGTWVGTITAEGDVTTVFNESGSVWDGAARLVGEASIGVDVGDDPYMFGAIQALAIDDERIYVLDTQVPVVRVFDLAGTHLLDVGREGQGPGEIESPVFAGVDGDGRVYVQDGRETEVFSRTGDPEATWITHFAYRPGPQAPEIGVGMRGELFIPRFTGTDDGETRRERVEIVDYRDGVASGVRPVPGLGHEPSRIVAVFRRPGSESISGFPPPFAPELVWGIGSRGAIFVGRADRYEIERREAGGSVLRISRAWEPTPIESEEREWYLRRTRAFLRRADELSGYDLDAGLPPHKPAFTRLFVGAAGRIWALRQIGSEPLETCDEAATSPAEFTESPCWRDIWSLDVFDIEGRFLGSVPVPPGASFVDPEEPRPAIRGNAFVTTVEDAAGTIMVKRYRLVLPGEE